MAVNSAKSLALYWLEPVALLSASRRAKQLSEEARARIKPWVIAAESRFRVARELRDRETQAVALGLLREAAFFALCALESVASTAELARSPKQAWERFDALPEKPLGAPEQLALVSSMFSADDALSLDRVPAREANQLRIAAEATVLWLLGLVEIRTPSELARARVARVALAIVSVVAVGWGLVAYWLSLTAIAPS